MVPAMLATTGLPALMAATTSALSLSTWALLALASEISTVWYLPLPSCWLSTRVASLADGVPSWVVPSILATCAWVNVLPCADSATRVADGPHHQPVDCSWKSWCSSLAVGTGAGAPGLPGAGAAACTDDAGTVMVCATGAVAGAADAAWAGPATPAMKPVAARPARASVGAENQRRMLVFTRAYLPSVATDRTGSGAPTTSGSGWRGASGARSYGGHNRPTDPGIS